MGNVRNWRSVCMATPRPPAWIGRRAVSPNVRTLLKQGSESTYSARRGRVVFSGRPGEKLSLQRVTATSDVTGRCGRLAT